MQKLFLDTRELDSSCRSSYGLTEEIMMENAAQALEEQVRSFGKIGQKVIILCGGGNNGADGYALSRRLKHDFQVNVFACMEPKSSECIIQKDRAEKCGVQVNGIDSIIVSEIHAASIIVDCIFGSGFKGEFSGEKVELIASVINDVNSLSGVRIACDIPSGIRQDGTVCRTAVFCADVTVCMGALKSALFSDEAKDFVGKVVLGNLGVSRSLYENSNFKNLEIGFLLEESDMELPFRRKNFVNKGSFGTAYIASGEKIGAGCIAARACLKFGAGLVTLIRPDLSFSKADLVDLTVEILTAYEFGEKVDALAVGMGLGHNEAAIKYYYDFLKSHKNVKAVLDADICYSSQTKKLLEERGKGCVLTPHPKEFSALLKVCGLGEYSVEECVEFRSVLMEKFCRAFPETVLLVKGSNPMIGIYREREGYKMYINPLGRPSLAKAGSGDVLSGMICALMAQGYDALESCISGSLAHALASHSFKNDYALTPTGLIEAVANL